MSMLALVLVLAGVGVNRLLAHFANEPVVVANAAQTSSEAVQESASGDASPVQPASQEGSVLSSSSAAGAIATDIMPCYTDDALLLDYLDIPQDVSAHPLLTQLRESDPSSAYTDLSSASGSSSSSGAENIAYWKTVNSDTIGWLNVPGTNINYPVVQGPYTNYYTSLGYDKNYSKQGVIWADSACSFGGGLSPNTVLYGHNWTNYSATPRIGSASDTHFAQLTAFHYLDFAQNHQFLWFSTEGQPMKWQIFAAFYTDIDFNYISAAGGQWIIDGAKARSEHIYDLPVSSSDKIITLSTCTRRFGSSNRQRFVVMAKLVDESASPVSVTANPNPIRPNV